VAEQLVWVGFTAILFLVGLCVLGAILSIEKKSKRYASLAALYFFVCGMVCVFAGLVTAMPWFKFFMMLAAGCNLIWGIEYVRQYHKESKKASLPCPEENREKQKTNQGAEHFDRYA